MALSIAEFLEEFAKNFVPKASDFSNALQNMSSQADKVNQTFGQGRQRLSELMTGIADAVPDITRLGGSITDVSDIMSQVAEESRRNVMADTKEIEKLYSAYKVLGVEAGSIMQSFLDVGVGLREIPKQLESSIQYIQSIGGNAKQVMRTVLDNTEQLNRFQFDNGVQGLTKMAAQASMLRFNMGETFRLADKVLTPEGAIETAAAFQRLGVAAGNLADPFQLMNQSINDPSGLQDTLANVSKQFTYFDEKTKTFKINPQGVLTLKEIEKQTGVSSRELSKMGLAAAELDKRLSAVSGAGLKIANEEDKQFLANIAKMGDKGVYEVTLQDGTKKELSEVNQKEFDDLIKAQKEGPKTLEELARSQMGLTELMVNDVKAIRDKVVYGLVSANQITTGIVDLKSSADKYLGAASKLGTTKDVRGFSEKAITDLQNLIKDLQNPNKKIGETLSNYLTKLGNQLEGAEKSVTSAAKSKFKEISGNDTIANRYLGKNAETESKTSKAEVDFKGKFTVDFNMPSGFSNLSTEQQQKFFDAMVNDPKFKDYIYNLVKEQNGTKQPVSKNY